MKAQQHNSDNISSDFNHNPGVVQARGSFALFGRGSLTQKMATTIGAAIMLGTALLGFAQAAPSRTDWCGTIWSIENQTTLAWLSPTAGTTTTATGPTAQITMPAVLTGAAVAGIGIHAQSGTIFAYDRNGTNGKLYSYQFGVNSAWQLENSVALLGLTGTQTIAGASSNLNKVTVDGNTLFIAESNGIAVYAIPLNASGNITGGVSSTTYTFTGDPTALAHRSATASDPAGTIVVNGGDLTTDEFGDTYNITYNSVISYSGTTQVATTTKAYFYKQGPGGNTWEYQGETAANAAFAGAAFYKGDLYVKAATQLKKIDLTRSGSGYTGWSNALINIGPASASSSADLTACGTPKIVVTKTQQIYNDAAATTLSADQVNVKTGQFIKYTVAAQNTGDTWARSATLNDALPAGSSYVANSAILNGTNLNLASYPTSFTLTGVGAPTGIVKFAPDPDTGTLTFIVQITAVSGSVKNRATVAYVDGSGLASETPDCVSTPKINCGESPAVPVVSIEGLVWKDLNLNGILDNSEAIWDGSLGVLTVYLVGSANTVLAKATVQADGIFFFSGIAPGTYTLVLSLNSSIVLGAGIPTPSLPASWGNTAETTGAAASGIADGAADGKIVVTVP